MRVKVRNFPYWRRLIPLDEVDRFDWWDVHDARGCVVLRRNGSALHVLAVREDKAGRGRSLASRSSFAPIRAIAVPRDPDRHTYRAQRELSVSPGSGRNLFCGTERSV